jgi:hypothetical protein
MPALPQSTPKSIYFPVELSLDATVVLNPIDDVPGEADFILNERYNSSYDGSTLPDQLLRCAFLYNSEQGITKAYLTDNKLILIALASCINKMIFSDLYKLVFSKYSTNENDPALYPNAIPSGVPSIGSIARNYNQYLASVFFTNPLTQAPFGNINDTYRQFSIGYPVTVNTPAVYDVLGALVTPASTAIVMQSLGEQFVGQIKMQTLSDGTNPFVMNLLQQLIAEFSGRFSLPDSYLEGGKLSLPFQEADLISFNINIGGALTTTVTPSNNPCSATNFMPVSLTKLFPSTSTDPCWTDFVDYSSSSRSSLTLKSKIFNMNLSLSGQQDLGRIPHLYATSILLTNANASFVLGSSQTQDLYGTVSLSIAQSKERKMAINNIFSESVKIARKILVISTTGPNIIAIGPATTLAILNTITDVLQNFNMILTVFGGIGQNDFVALPDTYRYSNATGSGAVDTCATIPSPSNTWSTASLNLALINTAINGALVTLSDIIAGSFNTDLDADNRIGNVNKMLLLLMIQILEPLKAFSNPIPTYLTIDTFILANIQSPLEPPLPTAPGAVPEFGPSLLNCMWILELNIRLLHTLTSRNIPAISNSNPAMSADLFPSMYNIASRSESVVTCLVAIDIIATPTTFIKNTCNALSAMTMLAIECISLYPSSLSSFTNSFIDPIDKTLLNTILVRSAVIDATNKLVFTQYVNKPTQGVTILNSAKYDVINKAVNTTDITSTSGIFADQAPAAAALAIINAILPNFNGVSAVTELNNAPTIDKTSIVLAGINSAAAAATQLASDIIMAALLVSKLATALANLTTAKSLDDAAQVKLDNAVALVNSAKLTELRLLEVARESGSTADNNAYHSAQQISSNASAALDIAHDEELVTDIDLLAAQTVYDGLLSTSLAVQAAINNALESQLLCKRNTIITQNASVKTTSKAVIDTWGILKPALAAVPFDQTAVDSAKLVMNAAVVAAKAAVDDAIAADQAQILLDTGNPVELTIDNNQLVLDQGIFNPLVEIINKMASSQLNSNQLDLDVAALTSARGSYP